MQGFQNGLLIAGIITLIVGAIYGKFWVPKLLSFVKVNSDLIQGLTAFLQLAIWGIALSLLIINFSKTTKNEQGSTSSVRNGNGIVKNIPLFIGTTWTYSLSEQVAEGDPQVSYFTEKVIGISTGPSDRVYSAEISNSGKNIYNACMDGKDFWLIGDQNNLFTACSRGDALSIADKLINEPNEFKKTALAEITFPLQVGRLWNAFPNLTDETGTNYRWFVESNVSITIPAGTFEDCFRILLYTLPDETIRWFCQGIGLVAVEYHHHSVDQTHDYRIELINYSSPTTELPDETSNVIVPSLVSTASVTPISNSCDRMTYVSDINYPDGAEVKENTAFTKIWRIKNIGLCDWNTNYYVAFQGGEAMGGPATTFLPNIVPPNFTIDISLNLISPQVPGVYTGSWAIKNPAGETFGSFYIQIEVIP